MTDQRVPDRLPASRPRATAPRPAAETASGGAQRRCALGCLAVGVDGTVLSVALPTLSKALNASESDLQWFMSIYFLGDGGIDAAGRASRATASAAKG